MKADRRIIQINVETNNIVALGLGHRLMFQGLPAEYNLSTYMQVAPIIRPIILICMPSKTRTPEVSV
jgi:hypothetical protein